MPQKVIGTTNLAQREIIKDVVPSHNAGFFLAVASDGNYYMIDPTGAVSHGSKDDGAWQCFKFNEDRTLCLFKHGVLSYGEDYLD